MLRAVIIAAFALLVPQAPAGPALGVLNIKIVLIDGARGATPVARHPLLISDNPTSAPPRLIRTGVDGTASVRLRPGNYTVESDQPVALGGKAYVWRQNVDIVAGRDTALELTADNADVEAAPASVAVSELGAASEPGAAAPAADPTFLLPRWQDSIVALWTPTTRVSGFLAGNGFIATSQRAIGDATSVEVQFTESLKLAGRVVVSDPAGDVAILWIDPKAIGSVAPIPMPCDGATPKVERGQEVYALASPIRAPKDLTRGRIRRNDGPSAVLETVLSRSSVGGPVFNAGGDVVGIASLAKEVDTYADGDTPLASTANACAALSAATKKIAGATAPSGALLPVEPSRPYPPDALKAAAERRRGSLSPYQVSSSSFDLSFITPIMTFGSQYQAENPNRRTTSRDTRKPEPEPAMVRPLMNFGTWSSYVNDVPPVLLVRITPRFVEGFWTMVARGAARTQGVELPPIKRFKAGFARAQAFCGDTEVTPIHPFTIEQHLGEGEAIREGLYVFDPGAFGPHCTSVKFVLFSEKEPNKSETEIVEAKIVQQVWQDFAPFRDQPR